MSSDVSLAVVTAVLALLAAGVLALLNNVINVRAGIDENLRAHRLEQYPQLWKATAGVSRWPRATVTRGSLDDLHKTLRCWYYDKGGLFLSEEARDRYGEVQELVAVLLAANDNGNATDVLAPDGYADLMETFSALRTALTEDLDTRRRKSAWDKRQRSHWHADAARSAKARISKAESVTKSAPWRPGVPVDAPGGDQFPSRSDLDR